MYDLYKQEAWPRKDAPCYQGNPLLYENDRKRAIADVIGMLAIFSPLIVALSTVLAYC